VTIGVRTDPIDVRDEMVELYHAFFREIFGYCVSRLFRKDLAEDATSEVFVRMVQKYPALRVRGQREIRSWLYGTASNVSAEYLRDAHRRGKIHAELARQKERLFSGEASDAARLDWPLVYEAICRLKQRQQEIVLLRYLHGFEISEIAHSLGTRQVTVRVSLSRAVRKLRRELDKPFGGSA